MTESGRGRTPEVLGRWRPSCGRPTYNFAMATDIATELRQATLADVPELTKLARTTFVETFGHLYPPEDLSEFLSTARSEEVYSRLVSDPAVYVGVAVTGSDMPVGYVVAGPCRLPVENLEPRAGEVRELYVHSGFHNQRLGSRLLTAAIEWLEEQNRVPVYVGVWSENFRAQRLYGRFGFEKVGEYEFPVGRVRDHEFIMKRRAG